MFLGIEIGGTKLQLGVGDGQGNLLVELERLDVQAEQGAQGILQQIKQAAPGLINKHKITRIGIGFGGPVDAKTGKVVTSHQIAGWEDFPLGDWCHTEFNLPTIIGNDCDLAALAEARYGAGQGGETVFFITVGTGVGGGLVTGGKLLGQGRPAIAEIGHLRPGLEFTTPQATVESLASGWGIVQAMLKNMPTAADHDREDMLERCCGDVERLTTKMIAQAAAEGNSAAERELQNACQVLGWAIAQLITLVAPEIVVVGGGVSLIGEEMFFRPLRAEAERYVFPPLLGSYKIVPAALGEAVVVNGALALAQSTK